ncbi:MAG: phenylacetate-CoA oxygenase subunit PaaC, partial [Bacteroidia bacterium]|nr:phenylacetate-CoA oxygenase subunit PaaC [Bacteroidia bacterium]
GQARQFLTYAGEVEGRGRDEDALAYHRDVWEFKNVKLIEQPNGDFAQTILKQYFLSTFNCLLYGALSHSKDETLAAIAAKSLKEVLYHKRHSAEWLKRLGDGTAESKQRMEFALEELWTYTGELFEMTEVDKVLVEEGIACDLNELYMRWLNEVEEIFEEATLDMPKDVFMASGSRKGLHTEHLGFILAEMQFLPRAYPDAKW